MNAHHSVITCFVYFALGLPPLVAQAADVSLWRQSGPPGEDRRGPAPGALSAETDRPGASPEDGQASGKRTNPVSPASSPNLSPEVVLAALSSAGTIQDVCIDRPGDGSVWAQGATYKARFGHEGIAMYVPLAAPSAGLVPFELSFRSSFLGPVRLDAAVEPDPALTGNRVVYDRGAVKEVYDLRPGEVEQTFLIDPVPSTEGDLVFRLAVSGGLAYSGSGPEGLRFETADGKEGVLVGLVVVIDAVGRKSDALSTFEADEIEIRVPSAALVGAAFPLTVDPVLTTFGAVLGATLDTINADVAYDVTNDLWCVVYEQIAGGQGDVYSRLVSDPPGATAPIVGPALAQDITAFDWRWPRIANNNLGNGFLVAAQRWNGANWDVWGRTRNAASSTNLSAQFEIAGGAGNQTRPDVGGDAFIPAAGDTYHLAVWEHDPGVAGSMDVLGCIVTHGPFPFVFGADAIEATLLDEHDPTVSKSNGPPGRWGVVWARDVSATTREIRFRQVIFDGALGPAAIDVAGAGTINDFPEVAVNTANHFLVVWQRFFAVPAPGDHDVMGRRVNGGAAPALVSPVVDLTVLDAPGFLFADQVHPSVDGDGCTYNFAYAEETAAGDFDIRTACVHGDAVLAVAAGEGHVSLAASVTNEDFPKTSSRWSSSYASAGAGRFCSVWEDQVAAGDGDIEAAFYSPGSVATVATACGTPPPTISFTGAPSIGGTFAVSGTAGQGGALLLLMGPPGFFDLLCGGPATCKLGLAAIDSSVPGGAASLSIPCDPALIGFTYSFQEVEIAPVLAGGCVLAPVMYTVSDTLNATVR